MSFQTTHGERLSPQTNLAVVNCEVPVSLFKPRLAGTHKRKRESEMRKSTTDRMNDDEAVLIGALEPDLVLVVMADIAFLAWLLLGNGWGSAEFRILPSSS